MFGWLSARSIPLCWHAPPTMMSRRIKRITPNTLIRSLPELGNVLYLHATSAAVMTDALPAGLMVAQRAFAPLLDTYWLVATSVVTDDGPREWCECMDRSGRTRARLHLLPDTDYLAWDALMTSRELGHDSSLPSGRYPQRADHARVMNFRVRELAGLLWLEQGPSAELSPLGGRVAVRIAHAESATLLT